MPDHPHWDTDVRAIAVCVCAVLLILAAPVSHAAADRLGVVLMHGKRGYSGPKTLIGPLTAAIRDAGILVAAPEMPWSQKRFLDRTFDGIMAEIDAAVAPLRTKGATRIVVGGHSIGGNLGLAYGARRDGLAGVLVIAPGHFPESHGFRKRFGSDVADAAAMISAGRGDQVTNFNDIQSGVSVPFAMRADIYLDFMDPDGPMTMPANAAALKPGTSLLLIIGEKDHTFRWGRGGRDYIYDHAPDHPKSAYVVVPGGHKATPRIGADAIVAWLLSL